MSIELWIDTPSGSRVQHVDRVIELEYVQVLNNVGAIAIALPSSYDAQIALDRIVELWIDERFVTAGFIRKVRLYDSGDGAEMTAITCYTPNYLLTSRIIAYAAGTAQASMTDYADDMLKEIITDNLGGDATGSRNIASLNFTIDAQLGDAPSITKSFSWRKLLDVCQDICAASDENGTRLYFEVVPYLYSSTTIGFRFTTATDQPGIDFGTTSGQPLYFGKAWGNLSNPALEYDHGDEVNYVHAAGQGEGSDRTVRTVSDTNRINASIWNLREDFADARNESSTGGVDAKAYKVLNEGAPRISLTGVLMETVNSRWGTNWNLGDKVVIEYRGISTDAIINGISFKLSSDGARSISASYDIVGALPGLGYEAA